MKAKIICKSGKLAGKSFIIANEALLGKGSENHVTIPDNYISTRHARIYFEESKGGFILEDLNSRNGIKLDGEKVVRKEQLSSIHVITLGNNIDLFFQVIPENQLVAAKNATDKKAETVVDEDFSLIRNPKTVIEEQFWEESEDPDSDGWLRNTADEQSRVTVVDENEIPAVETDDSSTEDERESAKKADEIQEIVEWQNRLRKKTSTMKPVEKKAAQKPEKPSKFVLKVRKLNIKFYLNQGENVVGRIPDCDIIIDEETVSRVHANISVNNDSIEIDDLKSKNHTFLGSKRVKHLTEVKPNTHIRFGEAECILTYAK